MTRSAQTFYRLLGFAVAALVSGLGAVLGWVEDVPLQHVIFYSVATFALVLWGWHHCSVRWIYGPDTIALQNNRKASPESGDDDSLEPEATSGRFLKDLLRRKSLRSRWWR